MPHYIEKEREGKTTKIQRREGRYRRGQGAVRRKRKNERERKYNVGMERYRREEGTR